MGSVVNRSPRFGWKRCDLGRRQPRPKTRFRRRQFWLTIDARWSTSLAKRRC